MNNQKTVVFFVLTKKKQRNKNSARGLKAGSNDKTKDFIGPTSSLGRLAKREIKTPRKRILAKFNTHGEIKITKENDFRVITKTHLVQFIYRLLVWANTSTDPGEGPGGPGPFLFFIPNCGPKATPTPPPPPLSQGLDDRPRKKRTPDRGLLPIANHNSIQYRISLQGEEEDVRVHSLERNLEIWSHSGYQ